MSYDEEFGIFGLSWARIHFIENKGMAFGLSLGGEWGKLALSLFRLVAIGFLIYLMRQLLRAKEPIGMLICFSLILAGAIGNMIDSAFYGMIFENSSPHSGNIARMFPPEGGYAPFLHGRVVDMLYFPMFRFYWPEWIPFIGGNRFEFFRPIFNLADSSIFIGVACLLLFYRRRFFTKSHDRIEPQIEEAQSSALS